MTVINQDNYLFAQVRQKKITCNKKVDREKERVAESVLQLKTCNDVILKNGFKIKRKKKLKTITT